MELARTWTLCRFAAALALGACTAGPGGAEPGGGRPAAGKADEPAADHRQDGAVDVVFSPQPYEQSHLARTRVLLERAQRSIDVAMYSFRDASLREVLEEKAASGIRVRLIYNKARSECGDYEIEGSGSERTYRCQAEDGTLTKGLEQAGIDVRFVNKTMHHKFAIVDGVHEPGHDPNQTLLVSGSGNWTHGAATSLDEDTLFIEREPELALRFQQEFNYLWTHSRDAVGRDDIDTAETLDVSGRLADYEHEDVHAHFTSANFSTRGQLFRTNRDENAVADRLVELIEGAESQILIASGHFRSRPVASALMRRWQRAEREGDALDVRVYLDGQEYISAWTHRELENELDDCIQAAGDSRAAKLRCYDRGFLFGYAMSNGATFSELEGGIADFEGGIPVRYKHYAYRWHYAYAPQMHHKYMVIDGDVLITGSYNLSDNAEHETMENMMELHAGKHPELVRAYVDRFEEMWETRRGAYVPFLEQVRTTLPFRIVFEPMALEWSQVDELKRTIRVRCPAVESTEFRRNPTSHFWCPVGPD